MRLMKYVLGLLVVAGVMSCEDEFKFDYDANAVVPIIQGLGGPSAVTANGFGEHVYSVLPRGGSTWNWTVDGVSATVTADGHKATIVFAENGSSPSTGYVIVTETLSNGNTSVPDSVTVALAQYCPMDAIQGDWVLDMQDDFGDGWNGASVTFEVDGVGSDYDLDTYTVDGGATATTTITVPSGATTVKFFFNSGDWDSEVTFQIKAPNGVEVGSYGLDPAAGEFEIDACLL